MKKVAAGLVGTLLALAAYLSLWPVPVEPAAWSAPVAPGYAGPHAANNRLTGLNLIALGDEASAEHIVLARDGLLYAAMASGRIVSRRNCASGYSRPVICWNVQLSRGARTRSDEAKIERGRRYEWRRYSVRMTAMSRVAAADSLAS